MKLKKILKCIFQIIFGVSYLHSNKIGCTHRDLKPGNIVKDEKNYRIIDFGLSSNQKLMKDNLGTSYFISPEIYKTKNTKNEYDNKVDVWSIGIILYFMLTNEYYFKISSGESLETKVLKKKFEIKENYTNVWSKDLKDLLINLLKKIPDERITIENAFYHPVFNEIRKEYENFNDMFPKYVKMSGIALLLDLLNLFFNFPKLIPRSIYEENQ